ncbi:DUF3108 domain-containing protein [Pontiella agarivorans]|uniref:DUF3108 domain-containing protein n=1 Tax=Pontiella agarivorans TaxID=3038953 RepID=A0ABU5MZY4_9BACT|nr:DUF3108 domain-containing protein [Pontiella agarivorans]MDZ8119734.1 DUF3108 domain-containing protein [Pontiella agarivorans]
MMKRKSFLSGLFSLSFLPVFSYGGESANPLKPPFEPGEKLKYSLGWQFIVAGYATLEVLPDEELDGVKLRSFQMQAKTRKVVDSIFKVRDTLSSLTTFDVGRSMGYSKIQREGKTKRDITVDFDWENLEAHYFEARKQKSQTTPILENTLDPLSAFYFVRQQKLEVGKTIEGPMTDGKRCKIARIEVKERKTIKVNGRKYDCFRLKPDISDVGGVFEKSKDAKIEIWCTADHRHIPVLLKSKVAVGSFKAELIPDE